MKNIFFLSLVILLTGFKHPYYLSVTDLKYNPTEKRVQGSVKIFTNDLENALKKSLKYPVDLINLKDTSKTKKLLQDYLYKHLLFTVNNQKLNYHLLGFEREQENVFIYIESEKSPLPKSVLISNSLLYDAIKEQSNIVHFEVKGQKKSSKVSFPVKELKFEF